MAEYTIFNSLPSSSGADEKVARHIDQLFGSFSSFAPAPVAAEAPLTPVMTPSEVDDESDDESDAGDGIEYTFADVADVAASTTDDDVDLASPNVPELEPTRKQDDDEEEEDEMEDVVPEPAKQPPTSAAPSYLLEEFGLDVNGHFDGFDLGEKPRPADYVEGSASTDFFSKSYEATAFSGLAGELVAESSKAVEKDNAPWWTDGDLSPAAFSALASPSPPLTRSSLSPFSSLPPTPRSPALRDTDGADETLMPSLLSPAARLALANDSLHPGWCGSVAVHDPAEAQQSSLLAPAAYTSASSSSSSHSASFMDPSAALMQPWAIAAATHASYPLHGAMAAPPSAFTYTPPTLFGPSTMSVSESSSDVGSDEEDELESDDEEAHPLYQDRARPSSSSLRTPSTVSTATSSLHPVPSPAVQASSTGQGGSYTAEQLARIAAAAKTSLEKPTGRKSSHHGRKSATTTPRPRKPISSTSRTPGQANKARSAPAKPRAAPRPKPAPVVLKDESVDEEMEEGDAKGKNFVCGTCRKIFSRPYNLKVHKETHKGLKKHSCPLQGCDKAFSRRHDLTRHLEAYHEPWLQALDIAPQDASADDFVAPAF